MSITYDPKADCAYLTYTGKPVVKTVEFNDYIVIDFSADNHIVGIEVVDLSSFLNEKRMKRLTDKRKRKLQDNLTLNIAEAQFI